MDVCPANFLYRIGHIPSSLWVSLSPLHSKGIQAACVLALNPDSANVGQLHGAVPYLESGTPQSCSES